LSLHRSDFGPKLLRLLERSLAAKLTLLYNIELGLEQETTKKRP
jgi:hypothetical protein